MPNTVNADEKVTSDLEKAADAVFSGETVEGFEALAVTPEAPAEPVVPEGDGAKPAEGEVTPPTEEEKDPAAPPAEEAKATDEKPAEKPIEEQEIPADIKDKTRERMEALVSRVKEKNTELDTVRAELTEATTRLTAFRDMIVETGLNDSEITQMLDIGTMLKTDPRQAFGVLQGIVQAMSKDLGIPLKSVDLLEGYADLQARVDRGDLSAEDAEVIAAARRRDARDTRVQSEQKKQSETVQHLQTRIMAAAGQVKDFLVSVQNDVDYPKIAPHLTRAAKFAADNLDPDKWGVYIKQQYETIKETAGASARPAQKADADNTPIVEKGVPGAKAKEVRTLAELTESLL